MILFVDDELRYAENVIDELRCLGFRVLTFESASLALDFFGQHVNQIELVICDVFMPSIPAIDEYDDRHGLHTGLILFERMRKANPLLPFVFLTQCDEQTFPSPESGNFLFLNKADVWSFEIAEQVQRFVKRARSPLRHGSEK